MFTSLVAALNLQGVRRIAATLVRSTSREVARARQRQLAIAARTEPLIWDWPEPAWQDGTLDAAQSAEPSLEPADVYAGPPQRSAMPRSVLGIPAGLSTEAQAGAIHRWALGAVGEDATLFLAITVLGESPQQLAAELGLSHAALRKRIQRIRTRFEKSLSQLGPENGMSRVEGPPTSPGPERR